MTTTPPPRDEVATAESSSQPSSGFSQTSGTSIQSPAFGQPTTSRNAPVAQHHHSNTYGSYSTHHNPIFTGPVYNIGKAEFTGSPSPPPPLPHGHPHTSVSWSPPLSSPFPTPPSFDPHSTANATPSTRAAPSPSESRSETPLAGRWVYVPERREGVSSSSPPQNAVPREPEEMGVRVPREVEETSRDMEEQLKAAFQGFLSKEHKALDPSLRPGRG